jgi:hypothetical protein
MSQDIGNYSFPTNTQSTSEYTAAGGGQGAAPDMMSGGTSYKWIGDMVNSGLQQQADMAQMRQDAQHDPCGMAAFVREILGTSYLLKFSDAIGAARVDSAFLVDWIDESIQTLGRPGGNRPTGGKRLGEFAMETLGPHNLIPQEALAAQILLGVFTAGQLGGPASMDWIEGHMPSGISIMNRARAGTLSTYRASYRSDDERVGPGLYLRPGNASGVFRTGATYRGPALGPLLEAWVEYQIENVSSGSDLNPREDLIYRVGTWRGSAQYGLWQEGDLVLYGSEVERLERLEQEMIAIEEEGRGLCSAREQLMQDFAENDRIQANQDRETRRRLDQADSRRKDWAVIAAVGLSAWILARRR